ncbi:MAG: OmpP1/FadL family transporter [Pseudomonadales bacterium]|nr:OmpP1/FadL family transporter [Pseudomonadales bacterium]NRA16537.1 transporter [Oceanospirillaceae bacterium]
MIKINRMNKGGAVLGSVALLIAATSVQGAGFQLKEQSAEGQGNSFAGQTAKAVDASTIFFNPAGMTMIEGNHVQTNLSYIAPSAEYSHGSSTSFAPLFSRSSGIDGGESAIVPAAYALWDYNQQVKLGISINAPFGLSTKFDEDWVGAQYNVFSEIKTINIAPSVAYRVNEKLSVGGNLQFQKIEGKLTNRSVVGAGVDALTTLKADDTGFGYALGFLYEYSDNGRVGFNYRSQIKHTLEGDVFTTGVGGFNAKADVTMPAVASAGVYHQVSDQWTLLGDVAWTDWSVFDKLQVVNTDSNSNSSLTTYNWEDTIFVALGANYQYSDKLQLKFGVAYDQGAANDEDRTAGIPDATRYWASVGASYQLNKQSTINIGYSHIEAQTAKISEDSKLSTPAPTLGSDYEGSFNPKVDIISIGLDYQF